MSSSTRRGRGFTLAAAEAMGYASIGVEKDPLYFNMALEAIPKLVQFSPGATRSTR